MASAFETDLVALLPTLRLRASRFVRSRDAISDLVQDTAVRCLAGRDGFLEGSDLGGWAFTIMRNLRINQCRSAKQGRGIAVDPEDMQRLAGWTPPAQEHRLALREAARFVKALPEHQRVVVKAIRIHGASYDETALRLGVSPGTIRSRLSRAADRLEAMAEGI
ncbi:RNA polymerase sigma factor [Azospirillum palustre]